MRRPDSEVTTADLPPRWDGLPVTWSTWKPAILPTHMPLEVCEQCGRKRRDSQATGTIAPGRPRTREGAPIFATSYSRTLTALRCPECGHTTVDQGLDSYELEPEDYEPEGSYR